MMENAIQKAAQRSAGIHQKAGQSISSMLNEVLDRDGFKKRFNDLLGKRSPQFVSSIVSLVNADEKLQQAFYQSPVSVVQAALKAATFDLPIDQNLGYAYIVPFNNKVKTEAGEEKRMEATFILGWKGMHQMALRSGVYKTISVVDVRDGEFVSYNRLTGDLQLSFIEDEDEREKSPVVGYAGYYRLVNGAEKTIYMTKKQVEAHERRFRKGQYMGKGWRQDFDAMALKTVYRQLIGKWGVMSIDYRTSQDAADLAKQIADEDSFSADFSLPGNPGPIEANGFEINPDTGEAIPMDGASTEDGQVSFQGA